MKTSLRLYINWPELVMRVKDPDKLLDIAVRADEEGLAHVRDKYPEYFCDTPVDQPGPFPLSLLRRICEEHCQDKEHDVTTFHESRYLVILGLPVIECAHPTSPYYVNGKTIMMPQAVSDRYPAILTAFTTDGGGMFPNALTQIEIEGAKYFIGLIDFGGKEEKPLQERTMYLYPADLIDNDSGAPVTDV